MNDPARFEIIEVKVAYLESAVDELSDANLLLQRELASLRERLRRISERLAGDDAATGASATAHEPPPHY